MKNIVHEPSLREPVEAEHCIACAAPFKDGDKYVPDLSGGNIHFDCCGNSFCNLETGDPLDEVPPPLVWRITWPAVALALDGKCCGRKPIAYRRDGGPHRFCPRCDRAYGLDHPGQIQNWAWKRFGDGFVKTYPGCRKDGSSHKDTPPTPTEGEGR